ncbi:hypothetical protein [Planococcus chinensis]|uniref:Uncharacterized protein n=1 Tax=Planococcus chinensis TaxID=272917 RepID=A0ABW4QD89_9BACL
MNAKPSDTRKAQMKHQAAKRPLLTAAAIAAIGSLLWRAATARKK